jgi:GTP-binding protein Era
MLRMGYRAGIVALLGRPNAGKSTLVNALVGQKVAIVSAKPQTTRNRIMGIVQRPQAQVALLDTPGLHRPNSALGRQMLEEIEQALDGVDVLAVIVDAAEDFGAGDRHVVERARRFAGPRLLLLNKIDRIAKPALLPLMQRYGRDGAFAEIIPISALTGEGLPLALEKIIAALPPGEPLFPEDQFTDQPARFLAAELIREQALEATRQEVPHGLAVLVDQFEERPGLARIRATIFVERDGHKGILIGKGGATLKKIGTAARLELEELLGVKVFLELYVKVQPGWRDKPGMVRQLDWRRALEGFTG